MGYFRRSCIVVCASQATVAWSRFHRQVANWFMHILRANMHQNSTHDRQGSDNVFKGAYGTGVVPCPPAGRVKMGAKEL